MERGRGMPRTTQVRKGRISVILLVRVYRMDFFKLSNISLPSSAPVTIAKLSSNNIMSVTSFLKNL